MNTKLKQSENPAVLPLISIIMPAYNAELFIGEAISSVLAQTYPYWELCVIDDDSQDKTAEIVASFEDSRIKYRLVKNIRCPAGTRNVGVSEMATGEWICFLDADDLYFPNTLEKFLQTALVLPQQMGIYGFNLYVDRAGRPIPYRSHLIPRPDGGYDLPPEFAPTVENILLFRYFFYFCGAFLRREIFKTIPIQNLKHGEEDYLFFMDLFLQYGDKITILPDYVYQYRCNPLSMTQDPRQIDSQIINITSQIEKVYQNPLISKSDRHLKPLCYAIRCRQEGFAKLLSGQKDQGRQMLLFGLRLNQTSIWLWIRHCLLVYLLSFMPTAFLRLLNGQRERYRKILLYMNSDKRMLPHNHPGEAACLISG